MTTLDVLPPNVVQKVQSERSEEEVAVYARVRPLPSEDAVANSQSQERCLDIIHAANCIQLTATDSCTRAGANSSSKALLYSFRTVFDEDSTQRDVFHSTALPLVNQLFSGKNALLFTYGVTGSGKTFTMQGSGRNSHSPDECGLLPRTIDVIFNTVASRLTAKKYMVITDKYNSFQINTVVDACAIEQQARDGKVRAARTRYQERQLAVSMADDGSSSDSSELGRSEPCDTTVVDIDHDSDNTDNGKSDVTPVYAVFVSYVEIYNKYVYDLLDETRDSGGRPKLVTKSLREDAYGNMYVSGSTETEVRSSAEAEALFHRGQKRRRVADTQLNHESSRSHSIFSIRLVKVYQHNKSSGDHMALDIDISRPATVSQLALVDLAGSERTARTGNTGSRLREAGSINNSLMNLRVCLEKLRERQQQQQQNRNRVNSEQSEGSGDKALSHSSAPSASMPLIPYRNDKMTHLFKTFFEGSGSVRMIVCINPRPADYEENVAVLQFAELAQEVALPEPSKAQVEKGRHRPVKMASESTRFTGQELPNTADVLSKETVDLKDEDDRYPLVYKLDDECPDVTAVKSVIEDDNVLDDLISFLDKRISTKRKLNEDYDRKLDELGDKLLEADQASVLACANHEQWQGILTDATDRVQTLENALVACQTDRDRLRRQIDATVHAKVVLETELDEKELALRDQRKAAQKTVSQLKSQLSKEKERHNRRKRSYEEPDQFRGVGSRIAEMEAKARNLACHNKENVDRNLVVTTTVTTRSDLSGPGKRLKM